MSKNIAASAPPPSTAGAALTHCQRCGILAQGAVGDQSSRPFHKALRGLCTACAVCSFFQNEEHGLGFALGPDSDFDPEGLRLPHIQQIFARVLAVGNSELKLEQINWDEVIQKWALPSPARRRGAGKRADRRDEDRTRR